MSSFFGNMKKMLGVSPAPFGGPGYTLGRPQSNNTGAGYITAYPEEETSEYIIFELTFVQEKMGMSITEFKEPLPMDVKDQSPPISRPIVSAVRPSSEGNELGVLPGDVIISLSRQKLSSFEDFHSFIAGMPRPVTIQFFRSYVKNLLLVANQPANTPPPPAPSSSTATSSNSASPSTSASSTVPSSSSGGTINNLTSTFLKPFSSAGKATTTASSSKTAQKTPTLTEEEKAERRAAMSRAAEERAQAWDKKVGGSKTKKETHKTTSKASNDDVAPPPPPTEETQKIIQKVKEEEDRIANQLGYSPFKPHMSFSGNSVQSISSNVPASSTTPATSNTINNINLIPPSINTSDSSTYGPAVSASTTSIEEEDELALMRGEVDDSFAMIISLGDSEQERAKVAVQTVQKMLLNLNNNKQEMKFRSIRLSNKAFQSKVGCISGGVELLIAAGYHYQSTGAEGVSIIDASPNTENNNVDALNNDMSQIVFNDNTEEYLVHDMDKHSEKKLTYTISRLNELFEMQNSI